MHTAPRSSGGDEDEDGEAAADGDATADGNAADERPSLSPAAATATATAADASTAGGYRVSFALKGKPPKTSRAQEAVEVRPARHRLPRHRQAFGTLVS